MARHRPVHLIQKGYLLGMSQRKIRDGACVVNITHTHTEHRFTRDINRALYIQRLTMMMIIMIVGPGNPYRH